MSECQQSYCRAYCNAIMVKRMYRDIYRQTAVQSVHEHLYVNSNTSEYGFGSTV